MLFRTFTKSATPADLVSREGHRVRVRRSARARKLSLRLDRAGGDPELVLPDGISMREAQQFLDHHALWLSRHLSRRPGVIPVIAGGSLPVRGKMIRLIHEPSAPRRPRLTETQLILGGPEETLAARVQRWLIQSARADLHDRVAYYADATNRQVVRISVRDTRRQWGSASSKGGLSFSWRLIMAPPLVLDYVAAHEVAHLTHLDHSAAFWALVSELCASQAQAQAWLKAYGSELHRYRFD